MKRFFGAALAIILLLMAVAFGVGQLEQREATTTNAVKQGSDATAAVIYAASFAGLDGRNRTLGEWGGRLLIVNFWATWCAPCLEEIPMFVEMQAKHGVNGLQIVGIAADSSSNVANFVQKLKINYPVFADEARALEFSKRVGNRLGLLPFTVVLSPQGDILLTRLGVMTSTEVETLVSSHRQAKR
ncbi:MAG: TlpA family protein disulfide reductase [Nitrosomonadaceae bacterium]|jgi:thiol-disulfide isomerase/thioredoxin|nr:TlpA family protein disulfide reductase [Nitrosomonadaceae bacterium]